MEIDIKDVLLHAKHDIQQLRRRNEILEAKVEVINVFKAALLGVPRTGGVLEIDALYRIEEAIKQLEEPQKDAQ